MFKLWSVFKSQSPKRSKGVTKKCRPWQQAPAGPHLCGLHPGQPPSLIPMAPWGSSLCTQGMFGEHMHESVRVSFLTSVGFSHTTLLLTHQEDWTRGLPRSGIHDILWARTPSMPILQLCETWCFGGVWKAFPGDPSYGCSEGRDREGTGSSLSLSQH